ncbi:hypothetical protein CVT26_000808 [Gymnopilus dilepis]|uniref:G-patch domain-containing protein n=1 Tax=Gymnopilus dilepis TaxID=231916 RepID=A0A409VHW5_9AGAR|nr:hypothetical protein CVT26_000808 [Gymnopilus dilepis]
MATVTHYIHSDYNPEDRELLEQETGQTSEDQQLGKPADPEEEWRREASRLPSQRVQKPAPRFVPAAVTYDEWGSSQGTLPKHEPSTSNSLGSSVSGWYRSLTGTTPAPSPSTSRPKEASSITRPSSVPTDSVASPAPQKVELRNKNNWFITKVIQSEPSSSSSTPAPSLADILARDPPPLPSQAKYTPPVFLEIGPSNKGFGMLQRSGWNEGEPLGPDVIRRKPVEDLLPDEDILSLENRDRKGKPREVIPSSLKFSSRREVVEVKVEDSEDVSELRSVDVIDLTLSDSELDDAEEFKSNVDVHDGDAKLEEGEYQNPPDSVPPSPPGHTSLDDTSAYGRKALLTPIATVLKSDRLGIGLKAKTVGPYKASQKRVTHNAAALAAHVKAAEESRIRRQVYGRGRRGFERQHRREEEKRKAMMSYLKGL